MEEDEKLLKAIYDEYKISYKTWLYLEDKTTTNATARGLIENIRTLQIEFYKLKATIFSKQIKQSRRKKEYFCEDKDRTCRFYVPSNHECQYLYSCIYKQKI